MINLYAPTRQLLLPVAASLLLAGCIPAGNAPPPTRYYTLPPGEAGVPAATEPRVLAGPFELPEYLDRPQLVIRGTDGNTRLLDQDRWAERLPDAVISRIGYGLRSALGTQAVTAFPGTNIVDYDYRIVGKIARFEADENGVVHLHVTWTVADAARDAVAGPAFTTYSARLEDPADRNEMVVALAGLLDDLSADIAVAIRDASGH